MQVSARTDYALRAMLAVADAPGRVTSAALARAQQLPPAFLQSILVDLRRAGLLHGQRGGEGGYALTRPAADISVGDVVRAVNGALTTVRGLPTETAAYPPGAAGLREVWLAVHDRIADIVDRTSLADLLQPDGPPGRVTTPSPRSNTAGSDLRRRPAFRDEARRPSRTEINSVSGNAPWGHA